MFLWIDTSRPTALVSLRLASLALTLLVGQQLFAQDNETPLTDAALLADAARRGPAVAAVLDSPRETPGEKLLAILTLLDLGEADLAEAIWNTSAQADFDDDACAALATQFGTARLMRLTRREMSATDETPAQFVGAKKLVNRCLEMASQQARDPQRIAKLVAELNDPSPPIRKAARVDLAATGTAGAVACLEALAQTEDESVRANLMFGLTNLHPEVEPLLLATLADGSGHCRRDVAELAGYLRLGPATPWLAALAGGLDNEPAVASAAAAALQKMNLPVPTRRDIPTFFRNEIKRMERGVASNSRPAASLYQWWTFEATTGSFSVREVSIAGYQVLAAARLARTLGSLPGATADDQYASLISAFQVAKLLGTESPAAAQKFAAALGPEQLGEVLAKAVKENKVAAAIACAKLLGEQVDSQAFRSTGGRPSPLATAVGHADRELRYVALEAIMKLSPQATFAGASNVPKALWEFAAGASAPEAVVASLIAVRGSNWAAQLRERGLNATAVTSGSQALAIATESPSLSLILLDSDIGRPSLREMVFQLRSHSRTGRIPIAVLSSLSSLDRSRRIADHDDRLIAVPRPHDEVAMDDLIRQLNELGHSQESLERRTQQAVQALTWIGQLLEAGHPYDELLRGSAVLQETVYLPELVEPSLRALAVVGTAGSQQTLLDLASQNSQPIELRQRAATSFATNITRFGKQLTAAEIHRQYDRYNASEAADEATQQLLSRMLDVLEGKNSPMANPKDASPGT